MPLNRFFLAALLGCTMLAGCNESDNSVKQDNPSGTFAACEQGTFVDGKCVVTPAVITKDCEEGALADGECVVTPSVVTKDCEQGALADGECVVTPSVVTKDCEQGTLADGKCVVTPSVITKDCEQGTLADGKCVVAPSVVTKDCEQGTLVDGKCVVTPNVVTRCERGTLADGECIEIKVPPATDPVNLDDGMKALSWNGSRATITTADSVSVLRNYQLTTTQNQRKLNKSKQLEIRELASAPTIRTGSQLFDGLFAMAIQETRDLTVTSIRDSKYKNNNPIPCGGITGCFQTGDAWTYVWTRDTAYAIDLGLAQINPQVARNSLLFKISTHRDPVGAGPGSTEIVQDTGSGGSWPISTDRVVWARAAFELLKYLDGDERTQFLNEAYTAIRNTIESDRLVAYDNRDGLYRGETSFLDWRQQTYPSWMSPDVVHIAMSKTLSTNINHWKILDVAAKMAVERNDTADASRYADWASALKQQIKSELWLKDPGLFSMMKSTELDQAPVSRYELLGEALAVQDGIADETQATSILKNYPHTSAGAPVVWPQMKDVQVYHNRAIWPFVSSYLIKAAKGRNADVVNRNFDTIINGAALNLSNMENFEFTKLDAGTEPPNMDVPQINSDKQLWSVGGYIGSVLDVVFGRDADQTSIRFQPFITEQMHKSIFNGAKQLQLNNLDYRGRKITVKVNLPDAGLSTDGFYTVQTVTLNGAQIPSDAFTKVADLKSGEPNVFAIGLIQSNADSGVATVVSAETDLYGPEPVALDLTADRWALTKDSNGLININWDASNPSGTAINIYRNGVSVATGVTDIKWTDRSGPIMDQALCYTLERQYTSGLKNVSQRTNPACYWGEDDDGSGLGDRLVLLDANSAANITVTGSRTELKLDHGRDSWSDWGMPGEELTFTFTAPATGSYDILLQYGNAFGGNTGGGTSIETGITATVKKVDVTGPSLTATGVFAMPQRANWDAWGESTPIHVRLVQDESYNLKVSDYYNMSYLTTNADLNGDGGREILNRANISGLMLRRQAD